MFRRNLMPCTHDPALEQRVGGLYRGRSDAHAFLVSDVLVCAVIDALVLSTVLRHPEVIELRFVGHDDIHGCVHVASNDVVHGALVYLIGLDEVQMSITLPVADSRGLVYQLVSVSLAFPLSPHLRSIHFHSALPLVS